MTSTIEAVRREIRAGDAAGVQRLIEWLRMPSVSANPAHASDCRRAADWARERLSAAGFAAELVETAGPPVVMARTANVGDASAGPHVLFYGHYDVQPPDPLGEWKSPPFEPVRRGPDAEGRERIVARGAVDDKGQVATFLEAMRAWHAVSGRAAGGLRVTVMLEGEEEVGSTHLPGVVDRLAGELRGCDFCLISDTGMLGPERPAITYGVRGLAYTEVTLRGPSQDQHSGLWGGRIANPATELAKVLAQLWDPQRRVTIPGFYDGVRGPSAAEREAWAKLGVDDAAELASIGLPADAGVGEAGYSSIEREWARPTAEINGMWSGYTGPGAKTIVPASASAKVSFRLVDDQDPKAVAEGFFAWLRARTPAGCRWECHALSGSPAATVAMSSRWLDAAGRAIERAGGTRPAMIKTGGSIPIAALLKQRLGLETIFMGFGLSDDRVHGPNEKFDLACYRLGCLAHAELVGELLGA